MAQKQCSKCGEWKPLEEFYTSQAGSSCKKCKKEWSKKYNQKPEVKSRRAKLYRTTDVKVKQKEYREKNKDTINARNKKYQQREDVKARKKEWAREHNQKPEIKAKHRYNVNKRNQRDDVKKYHKKYHREYCQRPDVKKRSVIYTNARRIRQSNLPDTLTQVQWQHALDYFNGCCAVCGRQLDDLFNTHKASIDHWIPISYKGNDNPGNVDTNIVPLCYGVNGCNNRKHNAMPNEWLDREFGKRKGKTITARVQKYFDSLKIE